MPKNVPSPRQREGSPCICDRNRVFSSPWGLPGGHALKVANVCPAPYRFSTFLSSLKIFGILPNNKGPLFSCFCRRMTGGLLLLTYHSLVMCTLLSAFRASRLSCRKSSKSTGQKISHSREEFGRHCPSPSLQLLSAPAERQRNPAQGKTASALMEAYAFPPSSFYRCFSS